MNRVLMIAMSMAAASGCRVADDQGSLRKSSTATASAPPKTTNFRELSKLAGVQCADPTAGVDCISGNPDSGDFQTVELKPACGNTGTFGRVVNDDAPLTNRTPPNDTVEIGRLSQGLRVCIRAIAREGQSDGYYYVTPPGCPDSPTLEGCTSGWVDAADLKVVP